MAKPPKKPRSKPAKPKRTPAVVLYARIDPELGKAFNDHIGGVEPTTTLTAVMELAIREYLAKRGLWPPKESI